LRQKNISINLNKPEISKIITSEKNIHIGDIKDNKQSLKSENDNPYVKLSIDKDDLKSKNFNHENNHNENFYQNSEDHNLTKNPIKMLNDEKKLIRKQIEVVTKIIYTFDDGSCREITEKNNHTYQYD